MKSYPIGTIALYGPDNTKATKLVASIFKSARSTEPSDLHRWITHEGDVRNDPIISQEVTEFLKKHRVTRAAYSDGIIGCPHEEGVDYPLGGLCSHCPFWWGRNRFTHELESGIAPEAAKPKVGRNEPCPCGSGKKFKKCCGG